MNCFHSFKSRLRASLSLAAIAAAICAMTCARLLAADGNSASTNAPAAKPETKNAKAQKPAHKLTGAELYQINCNRCHAERYPTEFTPAQWKTLMTHMRVRANLPAAQAKEILKYLQEDSGN
jgi:cytochrome c5